MTLENLQQYISGVYPTAQYIRDYTMATDDTGNAYILLWNNSIGPQPTNEQLQAQADLLTLRRAQSDKVNQLQSIYTAHRFGATITIQLESGQSATFPTDPLTQQNVVGYIASGDVDWSPDGEPLQAADGSVAFLSFADVQLLALSIRKQSKTIWLKYQELLSQVKSATTPDEVSAVVWPTS